MGSWPRAVRAGIAGALVVIVGAMFVPSWWWMVPVVGLAGAAGAREYVAGGLLAPRPRPPRPDRRR